MIGSPPQILVVEDQAREREALARLLRTEGYHVLSAKNVSEAAVLVGHPVDLVISDLRLGTESGIDLLQIWSKQRPDTPFIVATAFGEVESAVMAMKLGAVDYLTKPLRPQELLHLVKTQLTARDNPMQEPAILKNSDFSGMVGQSAAMHDVFDRIRRVAVSDSLVLVTGESGTGKELIADAIHHHSRRKNGPYVTVNVSAIPEGRLEAELFGSAGGSVDFGDNGPGRFEAADSGTLLIDDVADVPLALQPKLLHALEGVFPPQEGKDERRLDVRVVAATSRNLTELVAAGAFREDLFYRLNVLTIHLPPLRQRREDVPLLIQRFLDESARKHQRPTPLLAPELVHFLEHYDWPGNIRQLRNTIENMVVMAREDALTLVDLPRYLSGGPVVPAVAAVAEGNLQDLERIAIMSALDRFQGNRTRASEALGISVRTLQRKLKQWGVNPADNGSQAEQPAENP